MKRNLKSKSIRTCILTRESFEKEKLLKIVKTNKGEIFIDLDQKIVGRSAYLKKDEQVIKKAIKLKKIEKALRIVKLPNEIVEQLLKIKLGEENGKKNKESKN